MEALSQFLESKFIEVPIDFDNQNWHTQAKIPNVQGWYYFKTNCPLHVLARQNLWADEYIKKRSGKVSTVKHYDLQVRCTRYSESIKDYLNTDIVYSGLASKLSSRAREHTFADPGTAALALSKYPDLHIYNWSFNYKTLNEFKQNMPAPKLLLALGEQIWRSKHGWPILCVE